MRKLIYADTFSIGAFHETFNASSLMMFSKIYPEIVYYAPKSSMQCVKKQIGDFPNNIRYRPVLFFAGMGKIGNFLRYLSSFIWSIILVFRQRHDEVLFFNYNSLWALKLINRIVRYRRLNVIITCHGELEYLFNGKKLNVPAQAGLNLFRNPNWSIAEGLYFCVLGKSILRNVKGILPAEHFLKFISFEHSFIAHQVERHKQDSIFRIGTVGIVRKQKGLDDILSIGRALSTTPNVEFYALGRVIVDSEILTNSGVKYIPGAERDYVSKELFNQYIDKMDCLIFTYPQDGYKFTASGALFDAIDREKIILSLHNDYFDEMFHVANLGKLFDSTEDMIKYLKSNRMMTELQCVDFNRNKEVLSYVGVAEKFKKTLMSIQLL